MRIVPHSALLVALLFFTFSCGSTAERENRRNHGDSEHQHHESPSGDNGAQPSAANSPATVDTQVLQANLGWKIPANQQVGDKVPYGAGETFVINNKTYTSTYKNGTKDLLWTAFTLVLWQSPSGTFEVLTQARAHHPIGAIEAPGGHLHDKASWREGAALELEQEAGFSVKPAKLVYLEGGDIKISKKTNMPYGNATFFVVLQGPKPKTTISSENDPSYGHQWIELNSLYKDVTKEVQSHGFFTHGTYYSFFRSHLHNFCQNVHPTKCS